MATIPSHSHSTCQRCGSCCRSGGPALHGDDRALIEQGSIRTDQLVTVRRGELALPPLSSEPAPVEAEFLKLSGRDGSWCCLFYDEQNRGCAIYDHRPQACRLLECWAPEAVLAIAGSDLLDRFHCIRDNDPLLPLVRAQEETCPCPDLSVLRADLRNTPPSGRSALLQPLEELVRQDLELRQKAAALRPLSLGLELFYFGRPLFQLLGALGIGIRETPGGLQLQ